MLSSSSEDAGTLGAALAGHYERVGGLLGDVARLIDAGDADGADERLTDFEVELLWHIHLEEDIVTALLGPSDARPRRVMTREHVALLEQIAAIRQALDGEDRARCVKLHRQLVSVLLVHRLKEDAVLFVDLERRLPPPVRETLLAALRGRL